MSKGKKFFKPNGKKGFRKPNKKVKKAVKDKEIVNKKALFNRYKDKQKVAEELAKKRQLEQQLQLQQQQTNFSESEGEEDTYGQLISSFKNIKNKKSVDSEESSSTESDSGEDVEMTKAYKELNRCNKNESSDDCVSEMENMVG